MLGISRVAVAPTSFRSYGVQSKSRYYHIRLNIEFLWGNPECCFRHSKIIWCLKTILSCPAVVFWEESPKGSRLPSRTSIFYSLNNIILINMIYRTLLLLPTTLKKITFQIPLLCFVDTILHIRTEGKNWTAGWWFCTDENCTSSATKAKIFIIAR